MHLLFFSSFIPIEALHVNNHDISCELINDYNKLCVCVSFFFLIQLQQRLTNHFNIRHTTKNPQQIRMYLISIFFYYKLGGSLMPIKSKILSPDLEPISNDPKLIGSCNLYPSEVSISRFDSILNKSPMKTKMNQL